MKRLFLIRHAKSSWDYNVSDHERPLSTRGLKDAQLVSKELIGQLNPDIVLSSDALRAKTTAHIFIENLNINGKTVNLNHSLYDFSGKNVLHVIKNTENSISELLIFGHNNAITSIVNSYGHKYIDNVPTCGVVAIEFEIDNWKDIKQGKTIKTLFPRDLKG
tara:strand:- start:11621 stop:12106 length:486 start_codon:yes stop_codon:yes gene_type:complete